MKAKKIIYWAAFVALSILGMLAVICLLGEENPSRPMSLVQWALMKLGALTAIYLCILAGRALYRNGYMPKFITRLITEE